MRLSTMGFDVTATSDPRKALEAVEAGRFDLALLDLRMEPLRRHAGHGRPFTSASPACPCSS